MENDLMPELLRRRRAGWAALGSIRTVTKAARDPKLRADLFNTTVLPALCYGSETWALTKLLENKLRTSQAALERSLVGITLSAQRQRQLHNVDIRNMSKVKDALYYADRSKHRWAGHLMRQTDNRWSTSTLLWIPR